MERRANASEGDDEKCPLFANDSPSSFTNDAVDKLQEVALQRIHQLYRRFNQYVPDQGELACLKAIILFRPGNYFE